jgi:hypothetical protein
METQGGDEMSKMLVIDRCVDCKRLLSLRTDPERFYCEELGRAVKEITTIPEWCPLEEVMR